MKNMDEFRRSVYEKAEKKAAEEKAKKLRITKFGTSIAAAAVERSNAKVKRNANVFLIFGKSLFFIIYNSFLNFLFTPDFISR